MFVYLVTGQPTICVVSTVNPGDDQLIGDLVEIKSENPSLEILVLLGIIIDKNPNQPFIRKIKTLKAHYDKVYIMASNELWQKYGARNIKELDDQLGDEFEQNIFVPDNACGELETKEVSESLVLGFFDSHWYISDWEKDNFINRKCPVRDRDEFVLKFDDEVDNYKDKNFLLFTYHPPLRYDKSGGYLPGYRKILPIPVIADYINNAQTFLSGRESATHPVYENYTMIIQRNADLMPNMVTISGQAKYQMVLEEDEELYLNVHSSGKKEYLRSHKAVWSSGSRAYLLIEESDEGMNFIWKHFFSHELLEEYFRKTDTEIIDTTASIVSAEAIKNGYVITTIFDSSEIDYREYNGVFFGNLNTPIYYDSVKARILNLSSDSLKLEPERIGGGKQTITLRLKGPEDKEYAARSIEKVSSKLVPDQFDVSATRKLVAYYQTASHPYGFLFNTKLENYLDIHRLDPTLRFLYKQERLRPYNDEIGDSQVLFRRRADDNMSDVPSLKWSRKVNGTDDFLELYDEQKAVPDRKAYLQVRLLDILISDWDRHADQWRWALIDSGEVEVYTPVPRDRDQALSNYDGMLLDIVRYLGPNSFPMNKLSPDINRRDLLRLISVSGYLDRFILAGLSSEQWDSITQDFLEKITPEKISDAIRNMPYHEKNEKIEEVMKSRLSGMEEVSWDLFYLINRTLVLAGSYEDDYICVDCAENTATMAGGKNDSLIYFTRSFKPGEIQKIWIYSFDGEDKIETRNCKSSGLSFRIVGGYGNDEYITDLPDRRIYEDHLDETPRSVKRSKNKDLHALTRADFLMDNVIVLPELSSSHDDGLRIGARVTKQDYGFKNMIEQQISMQYISRRRSTTFRYYIETNSIISSLNHSLEIAVNGPRYEENYFGVTNEEMEDFEFSDDFFFLQTFKPSAIYGIFHEGDQGGTTKLSLGAYRTNISFDDNRFISQDFDREDPDFLVHSYGLAGLSYSIERFDRSLVPANGISIDAEIQYHNQLNNSRDNHFMRFNFRVENYTSFFKHNNLLLGSCVGFTHVAGDPFFFDLPAVGGRESLRGFRWQRFRGQTAAYNNNQLMIYLRRRDGGDGRIFSYGVIMSFDHGRVWGPSITSEQWHYSYGGGVFLSPFDFIVVNLQLHKSSEDLLARFGFGWSLN